MTRINPLCARFSRGSVVVPLLAALVVVLLAAAPGSAGLTELSGAAAAPSTAHAAEWSWRTLGEEGWGAWTPLAAGPPLAQTPSAPQALLEALDLQLAPAMRAVEMRGRDVGEALTLQRVVLWTAERPARELPRVNAQDASADGTRLDPGGSAQAVSRSSAGADPHKLINAELQGRLLYLDRIFDLSGYTGGTRRLPLRRLAIELVRSSDDSLMVSGSTDDEGFFLLEYEAAAPEDLRLRIMSRVEGHPGLAPRVLDSAGPGGDLSASSLLQYTVLEIVGMGPGTALDLGEVDLQPGGSDDVLAAFNLLDCLLDVSELLSLPSWLGSAPDSLPPLIWSPTTVHLDTRYQDGVVRVASPGGGDDDSWADAVVLAALGDWYLQRYSRYDPAPGTGAWNTASDPRFAYQKGAGAVFAGLVRQQRAVSRMDADGAPADAAVSAAVDLGFPPPLGFPGLAEDGFDLETRELSFGGTADPRGQSSVANVAAMLWDLVDDESTPDGAAGDDDPRRTAGDDGAARFHLHASVSLPALAPAEAITYEDFHIAWRSSHGEFAALDSIAVSVGRTALFEDLFEDDSDPLVGPAVIPWVQPEPAPGGGIVMSELQLGDRDWVELSNRGTLPVPLDGWRIVARRNGFATGPERDTVIPAGVALAPGRSLVVFEGGEAIHDDALALHDPAWSVPWREGADGACILYDDAGIAVDFVRWDAAGEPSAENPPPGQSFSGSLASPPFGLSLSRDSLAGDSDQAADFTATDPNPYAPNAGFLRLHSLDPSNEVDHLRMDVQADAQIWVLATAVRDAPEPSLTLLDLAGQPVWTQAPRGGDEGSALMQWTPSSDELRSVRLTQDAVPLIATALRFGAWVPWDSGVLHAVTELQALPRDEDPSIDTVDLAWTNQSFYDELRLFVDGGLHSTLGGTSQSSTLSLSQGHHRIELEPRFLGVAGPRTTTSVFVGATPRFSGSGFEPGDSSIFDYTAFTELDLPGAIGRALLDHNNPTQFYPPDDEALAELRDPIVLTSDSVLRFRHAAHLVDDGDRAHVEISLDDGVDWQALAEYQGGDHSGGGDPADWTDVTLTPGDWVDEQLDLSAFAGARALIRFRRVSDASGESLGWAVDDVFFGTPLDRRIWVTASGDDAFGCGHVERPYATLGRGLSQTVYGDTLRVGAGAFSDVTLVAMDGSQRPVNLALPAGVSVRGEGSAATLVSIAGLGTGVYAGPSTGWAAGDSAQVQGLTLFSGSRGLRVDLGVVVAGDLHFESNGTGILVGGGELSAQRILLTRCGRAARQESGRFFLSQSTLTDMERALYVQTSADSTRVETSIFTRIFETAIELDLGAPAPVITCNDFFGFSGSPDVFLGLANPVGQDGNVALPVQFCDRFSGDYSLAAGSPLLDLAGCGPVGAFGQGCAATAADAPPPPGRTGLLGNHPNPFNPRTRIRFALAQEGAVRLALYDARGRMVRELVAGNLPAGEHSINWDATDDQGRRVASGVYHLELRAEGRRFTASMALLK